MTKEQIDNDIKLFWEALEETRRFIKELSSKQPAKLYGTETKLCIIDECTVLEIDKRLKRRKDEDTD